MQRLQPVRSCWERLPSQPSRRAPCCGVDLDSEQAPGASIVPVEEAGAGGPAREPGPHLANLVGWSARLCSARLSSARLCSAQLSCRISGFPDIRTRAELTGPQPTARCSRSRILVVDVRGHQELPLSRIPERGTLDAEQPPESRRLVPDLPDRTLTFRTTF